MANFNDLAANRHLRLSFHIALRCQCKALESHFKKPPSSPNMLSNVLGRGTFKLKRLQREALCFYLNMWLSTIWIALSIVLTSDAHPTTATIALCAWVLHRRWEKTTSIRA